MPATKPSRRTIHTKKKLGFSRRKRMDLKQWSLRGKIVLVGVLLPTLLIAGLFRLYSRESKEKTITDYTDKARAICLTAESTR